MYVTAARKPAANANLDRMVADCMKDTNSDEELPEEEDDPALLVNNIIHQNHAKELKQHEIAPHLNPFVLSERVTDAG